MLLKSQRQLQWLRQNKPELLEQVSSEVPVEQLPERLPPQQRAQPKPYKSSPALFSSPKRKLFGKL